MHHDRKRQLRKQAMESIKNTANARHTPTHVRDAIIQYHKDMLALLNESDAAFERTLALTEAAYIDGLSTSKIHSDKSAAEMWMQSKAREDAYKTDE